MGFVEFNQDDYPDEVGRLDDQIGKGITVYDVFKIMKTYDEDDGIPSISEVYIKLVFDKVEKKIKELIKEKGIEENRVEFQLYSNFSASSISINNINIYSLNDIERELEKIHKEQIKENEEYPDWMFDLAKALGLEDEVEKKLEKIKNDISIFKVDDKYAELTVKESVSKINEIIDELKVRDILNDLVTYSFDSEDKTNVKILIGDIPIKNIKDIEEAIKETLKNYKNDKKHNKFRLEDDGQIVREKDNELILIKKNKKKNRGISK